MAWSWHPGRLFNNFSIVVVEKLGEMSVVGVRVQITLMQGLNIVCRLFRPFALVHLLGRSQVQGFLGCNRTLCLIAICKHLAYFQLDLVLINIQTYIALYFFVFEPWIAFVSFMRVLTSGIDKSARVMNNNCFAIFI